MGTARRDRITIVRYDEAWPAAFEAQAEPLQRVLGPILVRPIEHIGSTAIPGLAAKAIIDMLAVVGTYDDLPPRVAALAQIRWVHAPEPGDESRRTWSLCHPDARERTHHLHVVEESSDQWPLWLAFRDRLRRDEQAREAYAELKRRLAAVDASDRPLYRAGKAAFIREHSMPEG